MKHTSFYGNIMVILGLIILFPLITLFFYQEMEYLPAFLLPGLGSLGLGLALNLLETRPERVLDDRLAFTQDSSIKVVFTWIYGVVLGALPFVLHGDLNPIQAIFESVSGFTTTGLSVVDVSHAAKIILFHRSFMQYCGGLGFILLVSGITTGKNSMGLYEAEGHTDRLLPNLKKTARIIFWMYNGFFLLGTVLYMVFGMPFFDSVCHAMCALSTGGFSTKLNSLGDYESVGIRLVTVLLMVIGTTNFAVLLLLVRRKFKRAAQVSEVKFFGLLLAISIPAIAISLILQGHMSGIRAFYESLFNVTSALSTTGYSTMSYTDWPEFSLGVMIVLMVIGGGIGSTAGGVKLARGCLLFKIALHNIKGQIHAKSRVDAFSYITPFGKERIGEGLIVNTTGFFLVYMGFFIVGSLLISWSAKANLTQAMFECSSSLSTVGLSIGLTNPSTDMVTLVIETVLMLLGRLEIFTFFVALSKLVRH